VKKLQLHWQIMIAIVLAIGAGLLSGTDAGVGGVTFYQAYQFLGTLFMNALQMIVVPLIVSSIIAAIASLSGEDLGRLGAKTIAYYVLTSILAILVGLVFVNLLTPGLLNGEPAGAQLNLTLDEQATSNALSTVEGRGGADIIGIFLRMVPVNVIQAASTADMLGLIFFSLVFGFFMARIPQKQSEILLLFWRGVSETMMRVTMWIMQFAPIGVFGLVARTVASTGFGAFGPMLLFFFTVLAALLCHMFVVLSLLLRLSGANPIKHFKAMLPALLTAFSSASSLATLPLTMKCLRERSGVSDRTTSFVLPLGATLNMDGTALYECAAAIFLAQAYGLELSFATQFTVVLIALLTSIGVAGIPAASLVAITVILNSIGLPLEAIGLLLVTDRVLDMMRTAVNAYSDSCGAVVIAKLEKEEGMLV